MSSKAARFQTLQDNKNFAIQRCQKKRIDPAEANTESFV